jgi:hypothetical protein
MKHSGSATRKRPMSNRVAAHIVGRFWPLYPLAHDRHDVASQLPYYRRTLTPVGSPRSLAFCSRVNRLPSFH